jgi:hypothetical protein
MAYAQPNEYQDLVLRVKLYNHQIREDRNYQDYRKDVNEKIQHEVYNSLRDYYIHLFSDMIDPTESDLAEDVAERVIARNRKQLTALGHIASNMRVISRFTFLATRSIDIPIDAFFANYTLGAPLAAYTIVDGMHLQSPGRMLLTLKTSYGVFWFYAMTHCIDGGTVRLLEREYDYDLTLAAAVASKNRKPRPPKKFVKTSRVTLRFEVPETQIRRHPSFILSVSRIEPYICTYCKTHAPQMQTCSACLEYLGMRVRYCSKECQRKDFNEGGHKRVCGCSQYPEAESARQLRVAEWEGLGIKL